MQSLFAPGAITLELVDLDRVVLGGAVPTDAPLTLDGARGDLQAEYFCERREIGVLNIGGAGTRHGRRQRATRSAAKDVLYVGRGSREVAFASDDAATPARFYLVSYPAHASHPTTRRDAGRGVGVRRAGQRGDGEQAAHPRATSIRRARRARSS